MQVDFCLQVHQNFTCSCKVFKALQGCLCEGILTALIPVVLTPRIIRSGKARAIPKHPYDTVRLLSIKSAHKASWRTHLFLLQNQRQPELLKHVSTDTQTSGHNSHRLHPTTCLFKPEHLPIVLNTEVFVYPFTVSRRLESTTTRHGGLQDMSSRLHTQT